MPFSRFFLLGIPLLTLAAACGGDDAKANRPDLTCDTTRVDLKLVVDSFALPKDDKAYAVDLDADGTVDNHFGTLNSLLLSQGVDQTAAVNQLVGQGGTPLLVTVQSSDASFTLDGCPVAALSNALAAAAPPDFTATPSFTVDAASPSFTIASGTIGASTDHQFVSLGGDPGIFNLKMFFGMTVATIPLVDVSISGIVSSEDGITTGRLGGAIPASAIEDALGIPFALSVQAQAAAPGPTAGFILLQFDNGGTPSDGCDGTCKDPHDGACAVAGDGAVSICEVLTTQPITGYLAPDVHLFAADGVTLAPDHDNATKDAMSFGVGFTAVKASY